ncbi:hypothetical protein DIPPA_03755 [Diplonema papillatum]|nr:hypothetical protein DIPPA_03755 [Diplonema papillatum]
MPASTSSWQAVPPKPGGVQCSILQNVEANSGLGGLVAAVADDDGNMWVAGNAESEHAITVRKPQTADVIDVVELDDIPDTAITHMVCCEGKVWALTCAGQALIFSAVTRKQLQTIIIAAEPITAAVVDAATIYITTASTLKLYDGASTRCTRWWPVPGKATTVAVISASLIITGHSTGHLRHWDATGSLLREADAHQNAVTCLLIACLSQPSRPAEVIPSILSAGADATIRIWQDGSEPIAELRGHSAPVKGLVRLSPTLLASCSLDGRIVLWDLQGLKSVGALDQHAAPLISLAPAQSLLHSVMWSLGKDDTITVWGLRHNVPQIADVQTLAVELVMKDRLLRAAHEELERIEILHNQSPPAPRLKQGVLPPPPHSEAQPAAEVLEALASLATVRPAAADPGAPGECTALELLSRGALDPEAMPAPWRALPGVADVQAALRDRWTALRAADAIPDFPEIESAETAGALEHVVRRAQFALDKATEKIARLTTSTVSHLNSRIEDLMAQLQTKETELRDTSLAITKTKRSEETLTSQNQQKKAQIDRMLSVQKQLASDLALREDEAKRLQDRLRDMSEMNDTQTELQNLQRQKGEAEEESSKLRQENAELVLLLDRYRRPTSKRDDSGPNFESLEEVALRAKSSGQLAELRALLDGPPSETAEQLLSRAEREGLLPDLRRLITTHPAPPPPPPPSCAPPAPHPPREQILRELTLEDAVRVFESSGRLEQLYAHLRDALKLPAQKPVVPADAAADGLEKLRADIAELKKRNDENASVHKDDRFKRDAEFQRKLQQKEAECKEVEAELRRREKESDQRYDKLHHEHLKLLEETHALQQHTAQLEQEARGTEEALQKERRQQEQLASGLSQAAEKLAAIEGEAQQAKDAVSKQQSAFTDKEKLQAEALRAAQERLKKYEKAAANMEQAMNGMDHRLSTIKRVLPNLKVAVREVAQVADVECLAPLAASVEASRTASNDSMDSTPDDDESGLLTDLLSQLRLVLASLRSRGDVTNETTSDLIVLHQLVEDELKKVDPKAVRPAAAQPRSQPQSRIVGSTMVNMRLLQQAWHRQEADAQRALEGSAEQLEKATEAAQAAAERAEKAEKDREKERDDLLREKEKERDELLRAREKERDELIRDRERERDELLREREKEKAAEKDGAESLASELVLQSHAAGSACSVATRPTTPSNFGGKSLRTPQLARGHDDMTLLRQALEAKSKEYSLLQQDVLANRQRMEEKHKRIAALQELTEERSHMVQAERQKSYQLQREVQHLKAQVREANRRARGPNFPEHAALVERLAEAEDALSSASRTEDQVAQLQQKLSNVEQTLKEAETANKKEAGAQAKLEHVEQRLAEAQEQIQLQQELLASQSAADTDDERFLELEDKAALLEAEVVELEGQLKEERAANDRQQTALRAELESLRAASNRLQLTARDLRSKLEYSEQLLAQKLQAPASAPASVASADDRYSSTSGAAGRVRSHTPTAGHQPAGFHLSQAACTAGGLSQLRDSVAETPARPLYAPLQPATPAVSDLPVVRPPPEADHTSDAASSRSGRPPRNHRSTSPAARDGAAGSLSPADPRDNLGQGTVSKPPLNGKHSDPPPPAYTFPPQSVFAGGQLPGHLSGDCGASTPDRDGSIRTLSPVEKNRMKAGLMPGHAASPPTLAHTSRKAEEIRLKDPLHDKDRHPRRPSEADTSIAGSYASGNVSSVSTSLRSGEMALSESHSANTVDQPRRPATAPRAKAQHPADARQPSNSAGSGRGGAPPAAAGAHRQFSPRSSLHSASSLSSHHAPSVSQQAASPRRSGSGRSGAGDAAPRAKAKAPFGPKATLADVSNQILPIRHNPVVVQASIPSPEPARKPRRLSTSRDVIIGAGT